MYLWPPAVLHVHKGRMVDNGEADKEDIGFGIAQRANASITFLTSGIPQTEFNLTRLNNNCGLVIIYKS